MVFHSCAARSSQSQRYEKHISEVYKDFDSRRKKNEALQADRDDMIALEETAKAVKERKK